MDANTGCFSRFFNYSCRNYFTYQFSEKDGYFYGRGTLDDKAQAAIWIANLIQYKQEGFKPK
ncbi:M20/M25/M40 family metallo-hydrolase, partial [Legionella pneumophila]|uniref:M20/M25/M40 family metallo-hydrolase n=1 Tax=Legionella pneumophila TaxID=446 RepID=UPI001FF982B1